MGRRWIKLNKSTIALMVAFLGGIALAGDESHIKLDTCEGILDAVSGKSLTKLDDPFLSAPLGSISAKVRVGKPNSQLGVSGVWPMPPKWGQVKRGPRVLVADHSGQLFFLDRSLKLEIPLSRNFDLQAKVVEGIGKTLADESVAIVSSREVTDANQNVLHELKITIVWPDGSDLTNVKTPVIRFRPGSEVWTGTGLDTAGRPVFIFIAGPWKAGNPIVVVHTDFRNKKLPIVTLVPYQAGFQEDDLNGAPTTNKNGDIILPFRTQTLLASSVDGRILTLVSDRTHTEPIVFDNSIALLNKISEPSQVNFYDNSGNPDFRFELPQNYKSPGIAKLGDNNLVLPNFEVFGGTKSRAELSVLDEHGKLLNRSGPISPPAEFSNFEISNQEAFAPVALVGGEVITPVLTRFRNSDLKINWVACLSFIVVKPGSFNLNRIDIPIPDNQSDIDVANLNKIKFLAVPVNDNRVLIQYVEHGVVVAGIINLPDLKTIKKFAGINTVAKVIPFGEDPNGYPGRRFLVVPVEGTNIDVIDIR